MTGSDIDTALEQFYADLAKSKLQPLWPQSMDLMPRAPTPTAVPWLWRWETLKPLAQRAGELITIARGGDRRVLSLANPGLDGKPFASPTLWGAVQYLNAGESAPAHRHSPGAIRFVLEGSGVWTTINGDACDMAPGDLVLTPNWTWHDRNSGSDAPMIWFDGLDIPLVSMLDAMFFENYPDELLQPVEGQHNRSQRLYGAPGLLPLGTPDPGRRHSPLLVYRWADTAASLSGLLEERGDPMVTIEFVDPTTSRPALPTMGCHMHRLRPAQRTASVRRTGSSVWVVYSGSGSTVMDGQRFDWSAGDMFVVPSWVAVDHTAHEPSDLFSINDAPVLQALGLYREESLAASQPITAVFS